MADGAQATLCHAQKGDWAAVVQHRLLPRCHPGACGYPLEFECSLCLQAVRLGHWRVCGVYAINSVLGCAVWTLLCTGYIRATCYRSISTAGRCTRKQLPASMMNMCLRWLSWRLLAKASAFCLPVPMPTPVTGSVAKNGVQLRAGPVVPCSLQRSSQGKIRSQSYIIERIEIASSGKTLSTLTSSQGLTGAANRGPLASQSKNRQVFILTQSTWHSMWPLGEPDNCMGGHGMAGRLQFAGCSHDWRLPSTCCVISYHARCIHAAGTWHLRPSPCPCAACSPRLAHNNRQLQPSTTLS